MNKVIVCLLVLIMFGMCANWGTTAFRQCHITRSASIVNFDEQRIYAGRSWFVKKIGSIAVDGDTVILGFHAPSRSTDLIGAKALIATQDEYTVKIFEGSTVSDSGSAIIPFNNDRESTNNYNLKPYASPALSDLGIEMWSDKTGSNKASGVGVNLNYFILPKGDTFYTFLLIHNNSQEGWWSVNFYWDEIIPNG